MSEPEKQLTEKESLQLITAMIARTKESFHDTGYQDRSLADCLFGNPVMVYSRSYQGKRISLL